jgi:hypothetical protein
MAAAVARGLTIATSTDPALATGGNVWGGNNAGYALLDALAARGALRGASVLALGSGPAPLELAAAALGARVLATDVRAVLPLVRRNAEANAAAVRAGGGAIDVAELDWAAPLSAEVRARAPFDVVLASDCVFWPELFAPLIAAVRAAGAANAAAGAPPPHAFFLIEARAPRELAFFDALDAAGFQWALCDGAAADELDCLAAAPSAVFWARERVA